PRVIRPPFSSHLGEKIYLMLWNVITVLAATQLGFVARWQVIEAGGTDDWIRWMVHQGRLVHVRYGVYAVAGASQEGHDLMAACLACGPKAAASHLAAARLWGAEQVIDGHVQVTTFDNRRHEVVGVTLHKSRLDLDVAVTKCADVPVVVPGLAIVQCAKTSDPDLVQRIVNDLVQRNVTTFAEILAWIDLAHDGHRPALRALCEQAIRVGGHYDSPACRALCIRLTKAGATGFQLNYQVTDAYGVLLVDIAWPPDKVGLEYNGARDHDNPLARAKDVRRRNRLAAAGWTMLEADRTMSSDEIVRWALQALRATRKRARPGTSSEP
ncbi:MAG: hypothetical protein ACRDZ8_18750, partial [Acidimicrobiales bacterium]